MVEPPDGPGERRDFGASWRSAFWLESRSWSVAALTRSSSFCCSSCLMCAVSAPARCRRASRAAISSSKRSECSISPSGVPPMLMESLNLRLRSPCGLAVDGMSA